jgi:hypothetical protein
MTYRRPPMLINLPSPAPSPASRTDEHPFDIVDALTGHLGSRPGAAWLARVEVVDAETSAPRMVCRIGNETESWPIDPEDVATAPNVIADLLAELRAGHEQPD